VSAEDFSHQELIDIFWKSDAAEVLAHQWSISRVFVRRNLSLVSITEKAVVPDTYTVNLPMAEVLEYFLMGQHFGETLYVAVMCGTKVIVPPFPLDQRGNIPSMYPKESRLAARPGTPRLDI
jgi:hypothetical protein